MKKTVKLAIAPTRPTVTPSETSEAERVALRRKTEPNQLEFFTSYPNNKRVELERAVLSVSFLMTWLTEHDVTLQSSDAHGFGSVLEEAGRQIQGLFTRTDLYNEIEHCGGDPSKSVALHGGRS